MDERRNERFGRYEILSELGRGAMGVVYKARDPKINRVVAVKTISLAGQPPEAEREYRERFFREAEAAGRLSHPGIVTIFDVGEEPETRAPYIVMEFVGGESLEKLLSRSDQKLPLQTALQLALELAEALDCAHGQGVVHRDLKPANVLLTEDGHAKIADFGVAKLNLANITLAGRAVGTPAYMSPEQLNGEAVDGRSDLFSLGVVFYTILTGYRPFQGNSAVTVSFKVVNRDPIPATLLDTELPPGLDYIISRAMAKDPAERYQRGMEMVLDIQHLREGREPWSKAKQPGSTASAGRMAKETRWPPSAFGQTGQSANRGSNVKKLFQDRQFSANFGDIVRKKSSGIVVLFLGFLVYGIWVIEYVPRDGNRAPVALGATASPTQSGVAGTSSPTILTHNTGAPATSEASAPASAGAIRVPGNSPTISIAAAQNSITPPEQALPLIVKTLPKGSSHVQALRPAKAADRGSLSVVPFATLGIEVDHRFGAGQLSIWIDDRPAYTHLLQGTDKKRLLVLHHVEGHEIHNMQVPSGHHRLRVQVISEPADYDQSGTVTGDFAGGQENVLRINCNKHGEIKLTLE
jgi:serine/threonine protein kinase